MEITLLGSSLGMLGHCPRGIDLSRCTYLINQSNICTSQCTDISTWNIDIVTVYVLCY